MSTSLEKRQAVPDGCCKFQDEVDRVRMLVSTGDARGETRNKHVPAASSAVGGTPGTLRGRQFQGRGRVSQNFSPAKTRALTTSELIPPAVGGHGSGPNPPEITTGPSPPPHASISTTSSSDAHGQGDKETIFAQKPKGVRLFSWLCAGLRISFAKIYTDPHTLIGQRCQVPGVPKHFQGLLLNPSAQSPLSNPSLSSRP